MVLEDPFRSVTVLEGQRSTPLPPTLISCWTVRNETVVVRVSVRRGSDMKW